MHYSLNSSVDLYSLCGETMFLCFAFCHRFVSKLQKLSTLKEQCHIRGSCGKFCLKVVAILFGIWQTPDVIKSSFL